MMELSIVGRNVEVTDGLREYATERFSNLANYSNHIHSVDFVFGEQRGRYNGELIVHVKGKTLKAVKSAKEPRILVDELKQTMREAVKQYEERLKDHRP